MKLQRQNAILRIVRARRITSQDELREALAVEGFEATQATVSRDIRELGLAKLADAEGAHYAVPTGDDLNPDPAAVLPALLVSVDGVGPLLVLKTVRAAAGAVAVAIDQAHWKEVMGTLSGQDTVLIIAKGPKERESVAERLRGFIRG